MFESPTRFLLRAELPTARSQKSSQLRAAECASSEAFLQIRVRRVGLRKKEAQAKRSKKMPH